MSNYSPFHELYILIYIHIYNIIYGNRGELMEIMEVIQRYGTDSIFMILFIWLFFNSRKESQIREEQSRAEAREREERLYQMLEEFGQKYDIVIERLDKVDHTLKKIKEK